jgi:hemerythrin-like domain-containing protein
MKATELLQKQHREIEALLERLRNAGQDDEARIRKELADTLVAHTVIEERIFYPAVKEILPEEILEAYEEHGLADVQLGRLLAGKEGDETFEAKASVLSELVTRHIQREEAEVLRMADRELSDEQLDNLGLEMAAEFHRVFDAGFEKPLEKSIAATMPRIQGRIVRAKRTARRAPKKAKATTRRKPTTRRAPAKRTTRKSRGQAQARKSKKATQARRTSRRRAT